MRTPLKKRLSICVALLIAVFSVIGTFPSAALMPTAYDGSTANAFAGGDGSEGSPYQISNAAELMYFKELISSGDTTANYCEKNFVLTADIVLNTGDARKWVYEDPEYMWTSAIGYSLQEGKCYNFGGCLDGGGHSISGLFVYVVNGDVGLFARLTNATIKNLAITNSTFIGKYVGSFAGRLQGGASVLENLYSDANLIGIYEKYNGAVGGIAGLGNSKVDTTVENPPKDTIRKCVFAGSCLSGSGRSGGGILGMPNSSGTAVVIEDCMNLGSVVGVSHAGAIVPYTSGGTLEITRTMNLSPMIYSINDPEVEVTNKEDGNSVTVRVARQPADLFGDSRNLGKLTVSDFVQVEGMGTGVLLGGDEVNKRGPIDAAVIKLTKDDIMTGSSAAKAVLKDWSFRDGKIPAPTDSWFDLIDAHTEYLAAKALQPMLRNVYARATSNADSCGISFESYIPSYAVLAAKADMKEGSELSFGTLIAPAENVAKANGVFTKEALDGADITGTKYADVPAVNGLSVDVIDGSVTIKASIVKMKQGNYNREFAAVAYMRYTDASGAEKTIYANDNVYMRGVLSYLAGEALSDVTSAEDSAHRTLVSEYCELDGNAWKIVGGNVYSRLSQTQAATLKTFVAG
ncbi:MAG: hypothetical protein ACI3XQ_11885 [Eubacteriales bacterium]